MIRYQWRLNGRPLANQGRVQGADTDRLVVTNLSAADDGHVDVVVTNPCGTAVSPAAVLKVAAVRGCPADIADRWGAPGPDGRVDHHDLLLFLAWFFQGDERADVGSAGGHAGRDDQLTNDDVIVYVDQYFDGCAA